LYKAAFDYWSFEWKMLLTALVSHKICMDSFSFVQKVQISLVTFQVKDILGERTTTKLCKYFFWRFTQSNATILIKLFSPHTLVKMLFWLFVSMFVYEYVCMCVCVGVLVCMKEGVLFRCVFFAMLDFLHILFSNLRILFIY